MASLQQAEVGLPSALSSCVPSPLSLWTALQLPWSFQHIFMWVTFFVPMLRRAGRLTEICKAYWSAHVLVL